MKKLNSSLLLFCIIFAISYADDCIPGTTDLSEWAYRKKIEISEDGKYVFFFPDKEIYMYSNPDLSDLRITDSDTCIISYYIKDEFTEQHNEQYTFGARKIKTFIDRKGNTYYDFQIFSDKKSINVNRLKLNYPEGEFSCQIEIYGRTESSDWIFLERTTVFQFPDMKKSEIILNDKYNYRFYRIRALNFKNDGLIESMEVSGFDNINQRQNYLKEISLGYTIKNKEGRSLIMIENPYHLNILKIQLTTEGNYNRAFYLMTDTSGYRFTKGRIYNFKHNSIQINNNGINTMGGNTRNGFVLEIINNDDKPVEILGISAVYSVNKIVFENKGNKPLFVYFGKKNAPVPVYDIMSFSQYIDTLDISEASVSLLESVKTTETPVQKKINYTLIFNVLTVIIAVGLVILVALRLKK